MKRILVSLSIIGVVAAFVIGGTVAYFHDVEIARENIFEVGTLDLKTDGVDGVTGVMSISDMFPGQTTGDRTITLHNAGDIGAAELRVTFENTFDNFTAGKAATKVPPVESFDGDKGNDEHEMSREMIIIYWRYDDIDLLAITDEAFYNDWVEAADGIGPPHLRADDNIITLYELERKSMDFEEVGWIGVPLLLAGIGGGDEINWTMNIQFDTDAPNELQGDQLTMEIEFNLRQ